MFVLKNVWSRLWHFKGIYIVVILAIAAGFLCPIYVLGVVNNTNVSYQNNLFQTKNVTVVNGFSHLNDTKMDAALRQTPGMEAVSYECLYRSAAFIGENTFVNVGGVSEHFLTLPHMRL